MAGDEARAIEEKMSIEHIVRKATAQPLWERVAIVVLGIVATLLQSSPAGAQQNAGSGSSSQTDQQGAQRSFSSPEGAAQALCAAARKNDDADLLTILGPDAKDILSWSGDNAANRQARRQYFAKKYDQMHRLVTEPDNTVTLYVGAENWPFPIPLIKENGSWYFDTELGKQEVLYRRVGRNEIEALQVCEALVDAEKEYYTSAHQYTDKFVSTPGARDGLYWQGANGTQSPIGPHLANAGVSETNSEASTPYHGYYYRILLSGARGGNLQQGQSTGFFVVAFPADYRSSGVMTFIADENGNEYEKDLGPNTASLAKQIHSLNPTDGWRKTE